MSSVIWTGFVDLSDSIRVLLVASADLVDYTEVCYHLLFVCVSSPHRVTHECSSSVDHVASMFSHASISFHSQLKKEMKYLFALSLIVMKLIPGTILFTEATETPVMETFTVSGATPFKNGIVTVSGTYACTGAVDYGYIHVSLRQTVGRLNTVSGYDSISLSDACDGETKSWSAEVSPSGGKYSGGKAILSVTYEICEIDADNDNWDCAYDRVEQSVQLKNAPKI
jgi:Family of unknown function (DUF6299)